MLVGDTVTCFLGFGLAEPPVPCRWDRPLGHRRQMVGFRLDSTLWLYWLDSFGINSLLFGESEGLGDLFHLSLHGYDGQ